MTVKLYDEDSFTREFSATVIDSYPKADGYFTILDQTAFFPEGGGQGSDTGYINDIRVYDVQIKDGIIYHYTTKPFEKGERVIGKIDFERRFDFMQQHSAEHIVSGIAHKLYGCENVGFHLGEDIVTFDFDKMLSTEQISKLEAMANDVVFENKAIRTYYPDKETLQNLSYRSKKELDGAIRIVEIEDTDMCACCAPHVNSTGQIGAIKLLSSEKLRGGVRIELKAGKRALNDYIVKHRNAVKISNLLCIKPHETAESVQKLTEQIAELKYKLNGYKRQALEKKTQEFYTDAAVTAVFEEELEMKEIQMYADALYKKCEGVRAVFSGYDESYSFAVCGEEKVLKEVLEKFKACFTVKGGGRGTMVQGTVTASKQKIEDFFLDFED